jgi:hypothetical protein
MVSINPHVDPKMPFDAEMNFMPVAAAAPLAVCLGVKPGKLPGSG